MAPHVHITHERQKRVRFFTEIHGWVDTCWIKAEAQRLGIRRIRNL